MTETKMGLMTRLRAEGRWDEADKFRAATRARLKAEGMRRHEAREEAWRLTAEKYSSVVKSETRLDIAEAPSSNTPRIEEVNSGVILRLSEEERRGLLELAQTSDWSDNLTETLKWVADKAREDVEVSPSQARSVLAWLLWKLCREDPGRFIALHWVDYSLRHGETLPSILWLSQSENKRRIWLQFMADLKRDRGTPPAATA